MKCYIKNVELKIPFSFLLMIIVAVGLRNGIILWSICALIPHEFGHIFGTYLTKHKISSVELMPFGAAIKMKSQHNLNEDEFFLAFCGPAASIIAATLVAGLITFFGELQFLSPFINASVLLCVLNLIPALPLDGGRMLRGILCKKLKPSSANRICAIIGIFLSIALLSFDIYALKNGVFNPSMFILAVFIFSGAVGELKNKAYSSVMASYSRSSALKEKGSLKLNTVAMHEDESAADALKKVNGATLIAIVDDALHLKGTVTEGDLLNAMINKKQGIKLKELL